MSTFAYIRVSTEKQNLEVQHYEIENYAKINNITIDHWIEEKASGAKSVKERRLSGIIRKSKRGDTIIVTECSRLGRSIQIVSQVMNSCLEKGVSIVALKENYTLRDDCISKLILTVYSFVAEQEREYIVERTKEGLAAKKRAGYKLGRPEGSTNRKYKLDDHREKIEKMLRSGKSKKSIAKKFKVNVSTLYDFLKRNHIEFERRIGK